MIVVGIGGHHARHVPGLDHFDDLDAVAQHFVC